MADTTYEVLESLLNVAAVLTLMGKSVEEQDKFFVEQMGVGKSLLTISGDLFWGGCIEDARRWADALQSHPERLLPIRIRQEAGILQVSTGYRNAVRRQIRLLGVD